MKVGIYCRVSTNEQTVENQRRELEDVIARRGWELVDIFIDQGISGAKGRDKRPGLDAALKACTRRRIDLLATWSVDRLGRSLVDLLGTLGEIHGAGVELYLHQQGIDTTTPAGKAMFGMLGVFAEFERAIIVERVRSGMARARAAGQKFGPRRTITAEQEQRIIALRKKDMPVRQIAHLVQCSPKTVQRYMGSTPEG